MGKQAENTEDAVFLLSVSCHTAKEGYKKNSIYSGVFAFMKRYSIFHKMSLKSSLFSLWFKLTGRNWLRESNVYKIADKYWVIKKLVVFCLSRMT